MHTKLTLRINESLIAAAKEYSKAQGKSLSQLVANYLFLITHSEPEKISQDEVPPLTRSLKGILQGKKIDERDYKKYLKDKYL